MRRSEKLFEKIFVLAAVISVVCLLSIIVFIFLKGLPAIIEVGLFNFIFGTEWSPSEDIYGIFPMIMGSTYVTIIAILIGVPLGFLTSIYIVYYCNPKFKNKFKAAVNLLSGIPSVIFGFFGLTVIVPFIGETLGGAGGGSSILSTGIVLGIMILPTIMATSTVALESSPPEIYEGALAVGSTKEQAIFKVIVPHAKSGIFSGIILGFGRAVGETMAVILISGNAAIMPVQKAIEQGTGIIGALTMPVRTLTANIALEMSYATGLHEQALFATGIVLLVIVIILNLLMKWMNLRMVAYEKD